MLSLLLNIFEKVDANCKCSEIGASIERCTGVTRSNFLSMWINQYELLNDEMYQCDWYSFLIEMQQMFVTFMSFTQQPVLIHGYGNTLTQCRRDTFKKVINKWVQLIILWWLKSVFPVYIQYILTLLLTPFEFQIIRTCYSYVMALRQIYGWR